jgi:predicted secreted protein
MPKLAGRKVRLQYAATNIAGAITDSITINREPIDATDKTDAGVRQYLSELGTFSMSMSCSGHLDGTQLLTLANSTTAGTHEFTFVITGLGTYTGPFCITSFEVSGDEGANTARFSASFESGGAVSFTAAGS